MRNYVLAFMVNATKNQILLIKKKRPAFQAGKMNGIGGKIEGDETPVEAIIREVEEETGLKTTEYEWANFGEMRLPDGGKVHLFKTFRDDLENALSMTDEEVVVMDIDYNVLKPLVMPNLIWLIDVAMDNTLCSLSVELY
jgi:ADP-ribose pyrophosphatase